MAWREPIPYGPELFQRDLDPAARGVLRKDTSHYWTSDVPALKNLAYQQVLRPGTFDELSEDNKFIVISLVRHVVDVLDRRYVRKEPREHLGMSELEIIHPFRNPPIDLPIELAIELTNPLSILYLSTEEKWDELRRLASTPGAGGAEWDTDPAVRAAHGALWEFLRNGEEGGNIVAAGYLEQLLERGRDYYEDPTRSATRRPVLDMNDLDSDDMHAFLCAYATCFSL